MQPSTIGGQRKFAPDKDFKIIAHGLSAQNVYIKSARLNGKNFNQAWIAHEDILKGGELIFEMDSQPSSWGTTILPPLSLKQ